MTGRVIVEAVPVGRSLVVLRCPFCSRKHWHGFAGGYGHRVAHCLDPDGRGYVLVPPNGVAA